jgi:hypothetical protein
VADTALRPALIGEFNDLEASLIAVGMAVIGANGRLAWHWHGLLLPQSFHRFVVNAIVHLVPNNPGQFALPKSIVKGFEARQFLHHGFGDRLAPAWA